MKKILSILVALLMVAGIAYASAPTAPAHTNARSLQGHGQAGTTIQEYILVRAPWQGAIAGSPSIASGDVLIFDTTSKDGYSVTRDTVGYGVVGVAVSAMNTPDSSTADLTEDNWGFMAVRGECMAQIDVSNADDGYALCPNGATVQGSFGTISKIAVSEDVGVCLSEPVADGLGRVWLR